MTQSDGDIYYFLVEYLEDGRWKIVCLNYQYFLQTRIGRSLSESKLYQNILNFLWNRGAEHDYGSSFNVRVVNINELPKEQRDMIIEGDHHYVNWVISNGGTL